MKYMTPIDFDGKYRGYDIEIVRRLAWESEFSWQVTARMTRTVKGEPTMELVLMSENFPSPEAAEHWVRTYIDVIADKLGWSADFASQDERMMNEKNSGSMGPEDFPGSDYQ